MNQHDKFKVFIDADIIKSNSEGEMRIRGIASDDSKDRQGEYLDPRTMDLSDFDTINWNHKGKDDPSAIIGEPDKSKVRITPDNKLYVEGILYNNVPMAKSTYNLMNALQKSPSGKKLGMSVEGMVLERDPNNPNRITKSKITGVAICPVPVNGATWTELIQKGFTEDVDLIYDAETLLLEEQLESIDKAISIETTTNAIDNEGVDRKIEKESVEGTKKKKKKAIKEVVDNMEENITLSKAEVYEKIFNYFYINDLQKAKDIYKIISKISEMDKKQITDETVQKALDILSLADSNSVNEDKVVTEEVSKSIEVEDLEKAIKQPENSMEEKKEDNEEEVEDENKEVIEKKQKPKFKDEVKKSAKADAKELTKTCSNMDEVKKSMVTMGYSEDLVSDVFIDMESESIEEKQNIYKAEIEDLLKSQVEELSSVFKSQNDELSNKVNSYEELIKSSNDQLETLSKSLNTLLEENTKLNDRLKKIENTPIGSKSMLSKSFVDRFQAIEKGDSVYNIGLISDKKHLIEKAFNLGEINGDHELMQIASNLETTGQLTPRNVDKLASVGIKIA